MKPLRILLFFTLTCAPVTAQPQAPSPSGRFIVLFRAGSAPRSSEAEMAASGSRLVAQNQTLGISVVEAVDEASLRRLQNDKDVETVIPDFVLTTDSLATRRPVLLAGGEHANKAQVQPSPNLPVRSWDPVGPMQGSPGINKLPDPGLASSAPDALYHSLQGWAVRQTGGYGADGTPNAPSGPWDITKGRGVRIAVLDTGVDPAHPDIAPNLALNLTEVQPSAYPTPCDDGSPVDQTGHGTWTASLAAGALGPGTGLVAGVAPEATILNIKVMQRVPATPSDLDPTGCTGGQGGGLVSWFLQGIEDAIANHAQIISMSFGALVDTSTGSGAGVLAVFNRITQAAFDAGAILISAAGNDALDLDDTQLVELPAQSRDVLAIVASTNTDCAENLTPGAACVAGPASLAYYSNFGSTLNALAAPGGSYPALGTDNPASTPEAPTGWVTGACSSGIPGTVNGEPIDSQHSMGCFNLGHTAYVQAMGTSASAPLAAGAAALVLAAHPEWSNVQVIQALRNAALPATKVMPAPQVSLTGIVSQSSARN